MAKGCPSVWGNLPCAWTASRWAEPDKRTLAEFIPACRLCAGRPPVAAEPHGQLAVPVGYQFVTCARTRSANARATTVGRDAVIATSGFIREPLATRNTRCYVRRRRPRPRYRAKGRRRLWRAPAS